MRRPLPFAQFRQTLTDRPRLLDWGCTSAIVLLAFVMRLLNLGYPNKFLFDETYYAKEAAAQWEFGYSRTFIEGADALILDGETDLARLTEPAPNMVVHPELGKWLIGSGEQLFGFDSFGWRIASVLAGCVLIWALIRVTKRLTGSLVLGCLAGLLLSFDGLHFVLSRLGILDIFAAMFLMVAISCLVADRDRSNAGERIFRPWLIAAGIAFGLGLAVKWSLLVPLAVFGLWVFVADAARRRKAGKGWLSKAVFGDGVPAFASLVLVAAVVYLSGWVGFLTHAERFEESLSNTGYGQPWGDYINDEPSSFVGEAVQDVRSLINYHEAVYDFHAHELADATHPYQSSPLGWPLLNRPVGVDVELDIPPGEQGCQAVEGSTCLRQITMLGTPLLWWGGALALLACAVMWGAQRNWRLGFPIVGYLAMWLPWFRYDDRPIFSYYAITMIPFAVMALALVAGQALRWSARSGSRGAPGRRHAMTAAAVGTFVVLVILNFAYFLPVLTDGLLTYDQWLSRMWFDRWI